MICDSSIEPSAITTIQVAYPQHLSGPIWLKRDDLFHIDGVRGGKVRTCWHLAQEATEGLITAGSRFSPQVSIVSRIAKRLGLKCRVHVPRGDETEQIREAISNGAEVVRHFPGYNSVIEARAADDSETSGWTLIPFGMRCVEAVKQTAKQVVDIPDGVKRIVVSVGSGMTLCGILHGLKEQQLDIPVIGVLVGSNPEKRMMRYAPYNWRDKVSFVESQHGYHTEVDGEICGIHLDPIYEAKVLPFLAEGDLFWVIGNRVIQDE